MDIQLVKARDYLLCVDSDGCAIDGMTIKHKKCFGPAFIEEFGLERYREELLSYWERVNLYEMTRGINRFRGLLSILEYATHKHMIVLDFTALKEWVLNTKELSNRSLQSAYEMMGAQILKKALKWSQRVNAKVGALKNSEKRAFDGVRETLLVAHAQADIAVISAANAAAVDDEWGYNGLLGVGDAKMTQEYGNKEACIRLVKGLGYDAQNVIMVGDAPGDLVAAQANGVQFYPIMAGQEVRSWTIFREAVLPAFLCGKYTSVMMNVYIKDFLRNLQKR